jgi:ABC-type lipoprotein release transport system permease subunit
LLTAGTAAFVRARDEVVPAQASFAGVVVVATLPGLAATALPVRAALRTHPAEAIGAPQ